MKNTAFIFLLLFSQLYYSQTPTLVLSGKINDTKENNISNALIKITFNDSTLIFRSNTLGDYGEINLLMNEIYTMTISCDNYISKSIIIDAKTDFNLEDSPPITDANLPFQLNSKENFKRRKLSKRPYLVGQLKIDQNLGGLALDYAFSSRQKIIYEEALKKAKKNETK